MGAALREADPDLPEPARPTEPPIDVLTSDGLASSSAWDTWASSPEAPDAAPVSPGLSSTPISAAHRTISSQLGAPHGAYGAYGAYGAEMGADATPTPGAPGDPSAALERAATAAAESKALADEEARALRARAQPKAMRGVSNVVLEALQRAMDEVQTHPPADAEPEERDA